MSRIPTGLFRSVLHGAAVIAAVVATVASTASQARAQAGCRLVTGASVAGPDWRHPLDRLLNLEAPAANLEQALVTIASAAEVRISYSSDSLDSDRPVCLSFVGTRLGDALEALIADPAVHIRVAAPDHVVLAPARELAAGRDTAAPTPDQVIPLESVVVTGDPESARRGLAHAVDVIDAARIDVHATDDLSRLLSAAAPGLWAWVGAPSDLRMRYGSLRGASSFASTMPKVYIDGIEVANPLVLSKLAPEAVERIEVIRGPQGGARYGGAVGGVVDIRTKQEGPASVAGPVGIQLRTGAGVVGSDYSLDRVLAHDHVLTGWYNSTRSSAIINVAGGRTGDYIDGANSTYLSATGSGRSFGEDHVISGIARFDVTRAGRGSDRLEPPRTFNTYPRPTTASPDQSNLSRSAFQYTLGGSLRYAPDDRIDSSLSFGVDGYRLSDYGMQTEQSLAPLSVPGTFRGGGGDRFGFRASSAWRTDMTDEVSTALRFGADFSTLREIDPALARPTFEAVGSPTVRDVVTWRRTTGAYAEAGTSLFDRLYFDAGLRVESDSGFGPGWGVVVLPTIGAALVVDWSGISATLRGAYGQGARPAATALREMLPGGEYAAAADVALPPEKQAGFETGVELRFAELLTIEVTHFDQLASGLVQVVPAVAGPVAGAYAPLADGFGLRSVGEISNLGWEATASTSLGPLSLDATFATVDSRVRRVADDYAGDLRSGDRMLEVPARTASFAATWAASRWSASLIGSRAWDWINYDWRRLLLDTDNGTAIPRGDALRGYWRAYDGAPRLDFNAAFDVRPGVSLILDAENLLDSQYGEPDNVTIVPGRTLSVGLRARF